MAETLAPLQSLNENKYNNENRLKYPLDIENLAHAIIFFINVNVNSKSEDSNNIDNTAQSTSNILRQRADGVQNIELEVPLINKKVGTLRKTKRALTNIAMYVPENMIYDYAQKFDTPSLTEYARDVVTSMANIPGLKILGKLIGAGISTVKKYAPLTGYALNPVIEVLYSSPTLRKFQFDFTFAPKSKKEAEQVMQIIKEFRKHQAPEVAESTKGMFFIPPSEFDIRFYRNVKDGGFTENTNVPRISTCVLETMNVNYAPNNQFVTFEDGVPVQIQMRLSFMEMDMITRDVVKLGF